MRAKFANAITVAKQHVLFMSDKDTLASLYNKQHA